MHFPHSMNCLSGNKKLHMCFVKMGIPCKFIEIWSVVSIKKKKNQAFMFLNCIQGGKQLCPMASVNKIMYLYEAIKPT